MLSDGLYRRVAVAGVPCEQNHEVVSVTLKKVSDVDVVRLLDKLFMNRIVDLSVLPLCLRKTVAGVDCFQPVVIEMLPDLVQCDHLQRLADP